MDIETTAAAILSLLATGPARFDDIGRRIAPAMLPHLSAALADLEDRGLVERGGTWNRLTPAGSAALTK